MHYLYTRSLIVNFWNKHNQFEINLILVYLYLNFLSVVVPFWYVKSLVHIETWMPDVCGEILLGDRNFARMVLILQKHDTGS